MKMLGRRNYSPSLLGKRPFWGISDEMNNFLENFFESHYDLSQTKEVWKPKLEVKEKKDEYIVKAEVPGLEEDHIELNVRDNRLELVGEKKEERIEDKDGSHYSEMTYGHFYRAIPFDKEIDAEKIKATMKNGVLTILVAKKIDADINSRRIKINN